MSTARHEDALNERPALTGLVTRSDILAIVFPFVVLVIQVYSNMRDYASQTGKNK